MKKIAHLLTISALLTSGAYAAPFLTVGDGAEIFLTGTLGVRADSNVFLAPDTTKSRSDTVVEAAPGLQLVFGNSASLQGTWSVSENFLSYADHSDLNTSLFSTNFTANFTDGKSKGSIILGFNESDQNQVSDLGGNQVLDFLIHRKSTTAGVNGEVSISEKTSIGVGIQYDKTDYTRAGFADAEVAAVPVNVYYEVTPKVDLSVGYRYRETWMQFGEDSKDNFFNVGARGQFTPKLNGQITVGVNQRDFSHHGDETLFGVDSSLTYAVSPKSTLQFGVSNDFDTNSQAQQQKNFAIRASASTEISDQWSVNSGLSYRAINYYEATPARTDDYLEAQVGATYVVNANIRITGSYVYRNNRSDLATSKFDDNVLSITANFRY